jgi:hypothetical protein
MMYIRLILAVVGALIVLAAVGHLTATSGGILAPIDAGWATLLAGLAALCAGVFAYRGAMAAAKAARAREVETDERRRQNLYLKAEHMAFNLTEVSKLSLRAAQLEFSVIVEGTPVASARSAEELRIQRPTQLRGLWNNLSDFVTADGAISEIIRITKNFDLADAYLSGVTQVLDGGQSPLAKYYSEIKDSAFILRQMMATLTETIREERGDRGYLLYGDPVDWNEENET